mmetsp:Transcript_114596/g.286431  ORF Transcript_114596/g.286431 Transcript_114596/m.286431 type:complete len:229 (-) Transcript_114596:212-898(-)
MLLQGHDEVEVDLNHRRQGQHRHGVRQRRAEDGPQKRQGRGARRAQGQGGAAQAGAAGDRGPLREGQGGVRRGRGGPLEGDRLPRGRHQGHGGLQELQARARPWGHAPAGPDVLAAELGLGRRHGAHSARKALCPQRLPPDRRRPRRPHVCLSLGTHHSDIERLARRLPWREEGVGRRVGQDGQELQGDQGQSQRQDRLELRRHGHARGRDRRPHRRHRPCPGELGER